MPSPHVFLGCVLIRLSSRQDTNNGGTVKVSEMFGAASLLYNSKVKKEDIPFQNIYRLLDYLKEQQLYPDLPVISGGVNEPVCIVDGEEFLMFCANNYLSLSEDERVKEAGIAAIRKYGVGPGGSRVISGNVDIILELEDAIAEMVGAEACLTLPTGYMANVGVFKAVMDTFFVGLPYAKGSGVIFSDEYNHGSVVDGCRLSNAKKVIFKHGDFGDLEKKLGEHAKYPNKLIVTEGVFSLDGEITDLPALSKLAKKHGAKVMIDDAHGVGILGKRGGGTPQHHDCAQDIDIIMGCMDKAFGGTGGYLCGKRELIDYLRVAERSSILSSALTCEMSGAMLESVKIMEDGEGLRKELFEKAKYLRGRLVADGFRIVGKDILPSIALWVGKESDGIEFANRLFKRKIFSPVVRWPAVPEGEARFRIIVMRDHSRAQLDSYADACKEIGTEMGLL